MTTSQKKRAGIVTIVIIVLALAAFFGARAIVHSGGDNAVRRALVHTFPYSIATVNGDRIRIRDFEQRLADTRYYFDRQEEYGVDLVERPSDEHLQSTVLSSMIDIVLLEQIADDYDVRIDDQELEAYYNDVVVTQEAGGEEAVEQDLERFYGWTPEEFQQNVLYQAVLREKISEAMMNDEEINAAPRAKADSAYTQATSDGADFGALAQQLSEDEATAGSGGSLGTITRGQYDTAFDEAVFAAEPGTIVGPVRSHIGYHVIAVNEKDEATGTAQVQHILVKTKSIDQLLEEKKRDAQITKRLP